MALAVLLGWWAVVRAPALEGRVDNPRRSMRESAAPRGQILDWYGHRLAVTTGEAGSYRRAYPVPEAAPAVGYDSVLYGLSGLEASLDDVLAGRVGREPAQAWREDLLYGEPQTGFSVQTTLDAFQQERAQRFFGSARGAAVALEVYAGEVYALVSSPTFDPTLVEQDWDQLISDPASPLLNRATQGLYPPGGILLPVLMAAALDAGLASPDLPLPNATQPALIGGQPAECHFDVPKDQPLTVAQAFVYACPRAAIYLGEALGPKGLLSAFKRFGFFRSPAFELDSAAVPPFELSPEELQAEALGQGKLLVSPLQVALAAAAIANYGVMPAPRIVLRTESAEGWPAYPTPLGATRVAGQDTGVRVTRLMSKMNNTSVGLGHAMEELNFIGYYATALSGETGEKVAWFVGFRGIDLPRCVVTVALEGQQAELAAFRVGYEMLFYTACGR